MSGTTTSATSSQTQVAKSARQDSIQLLTGLTENSQLAPAIKAIYDRNWTGTFHNFLERSINQKDTEIFHTCNEYYEELVYTIDHVLAAKQQASDLKKELKGLHRNLQDTSVTLLRHSTELNKYRVVHQNLMITIHVLDQVDKIFILLSQVFSQIEEKRYFIALKTLHHVQNQLEQYSAFDFAKQIEIQLPRLATLIKNIVSQEFQTWLLGLKDRGPILGHFTLHSIHLKLYEQHKKAKLRLQERLKSIQMFQNIQTLSLLQFTDSIKTPSRGGGGGASKYYNTNESLMHSPTNVGHSNLYTIANLNLGCTIDIYDPTSPNQPYEMLFAVSNKYTSITGQHLGIKEKQQQNITTYRKDVDDGGYFSAQQRRGSMTTTSSNTTSRPGSAGGAGSGSATTHTTVQEESEEEDGHGGRKKIKKKKITTTVVTQVVSPSRISSTTETSSTFGTSSRNASNTLVFGGKVGSNNNNATAMTNYRFGQQGEDEHPDPEKDRELIYVLAAASTASISFTPLHQCLHVYQTLGQLAAFRHLYSTLRHASATSHVRVLGDNTVVFDAQNNTKSSTSALLNFYSTSNGTTSGWNRHENSSSSSSNNNNNNNNNGNGNNKSVNPLDETNRHPRTKITNFLPESTGLYDDDDDDYVNLSRAGSGNNNNNNTSNTKYNSKITTNSSLSPKNSNNNNNNNNSLSNQQQQQQGPYTSISSSQTQNNPILPSSPIPGHGPSGSTSNQIVSLVQLQQLYSELIGFFVIEDSIIRTGAQLLTRTELETLWDRGAMSLRGYLEEFLLSIDNPQDFLLAKDCTIIFLSTLETYHFNCTILYELLAEVISKFKDLCLISFTYELKKIAQVERYESLTIYDLEDYNNFVILLGLSQLHANSTTAATLNQLNNPTSNGSSGIVNNSREFSTTMQPPATSSTTQSPLMISTLSSPMFSPNNNNNNSNNNNNNGSSTKHGNDITFPITLPFSLSVPLLSYLIRSFTALLFEYSYGLSLPTISLTGTIVTYISQLVKDFVDSYLLKNKPDYNNNSKDGNKTSTLQTSVPLAVQSRMNAMYMIIFLQQHVKYINCFIEHRLGDNSTITHLSCLANLEHTMKVFDRLIIDILKQKVDNISYVTEYNWVNTQYTNEASDAMLDLTTFLHTTLSCTIFLPTNIRQDVCIQCYEHIAQTIIFALSEDQPVKYFTQVALYNFLYDILEFEILSNTYKSSTHVMDSTDAMYTGGIDKKGKRGSVPELDVHGKKSHKKSHKKENKYNYLQNRPYDPSHDPKAFSARSVTEPTPSDSLLTISFQRLRQLCLLFVTNDFEAFFDAEEEGGERSIKYNLLDGIFLQTFCAKFRPTPAPAELPFGVRHVRKEDVDRFLTKLKLKIDQGVL